MCIYAHFSKRCRWSCHLFLQCIVDGRMTRSRKRLCRPGKFLLRALLAMVCTEKIVHTLHCALSYDIHTFSQGCQTTKERSRSWTKPNGSLWCAHWCMICTWQLGSDTRVQLQSGGNMQIKSIRDICLSTLLCTVWLLTIGAESWDGYPDISSSSPRRRRLRYNQKSVCEIGFVVKTANAEECKVTFHHPLVQGCRLSIGNYQMDFF